MVDSNHTVVEQREEGIECQFHALISNVPTDIYSTAVITIVLNMIFSVVATVSNSLVLVGIIKSRELQTPSNLLLLCLASSDVAVGAIVQPLFIVTYINIIIPDKTCLVIDVKILRTVVYVCGGLSFLSVAVISAERLLAITFPYKHTKHCTRSRIITAIFSIWLLSVLLPASNFIGLDIYLFYKLIISLVCSNILMISGIYLTLFRIALKHRVQIQTQQGAAALTQQTSELKTVKTIAIVVGALIVCYTPSIVAMVMYIVWDDETRMRYGELLLFPWSETIVFLNSSLNPGIYCWKNAEIRRAVQKLVGENRVGIDQQVRLSPAISAVHFTR